MNEIKRLLGKSWGPSVAAEHPDGGVMWIRPPEFSEFPYLHHLLVSEISPDAGSMETMIAVFRKNSDSFWVVDHLPPQAEAPHIAGFYAFLPLNKEGVEALEADTLDRANPPLTMIAPFATEPAGMYLWAVVARKIAKRINPLIDRGMGKIYLHVPVYAAASTEGGLKAGTERGFASDGGNRKGKLMKLPPPSKERAA